MKTKLITFALCLALTSLASAAAKRGRKARTSTLPPTSKMIVLPPVPQVRDAAAGGSGLITTEIGGRDLDFLHSSVETGLLIVALGELAKTRAEVGAIKDLGSALANTQADENKQLMRLASLKGVTLSSEAPAEKDKIFEEIDKLTGVNFDKACMDKIIAVSKDSVAAYETAVESKDADIKSFSEQMLPISKEKLRLAEKMTGAGLKAAKALFRGGAKSAVLPPVPAPQAPAVEPPKK